MTYETPIYKGWWLYSGLIGLGLVLFLAGWGGAGLWLGLIVLLGLAILAVFALHRNWRPRRQLSAVLSEEGLTILGHPHPPEGCEADLFLFWTQITGVRLLPRPGYWETWIQSPAFDDDWLWVGRGLELAENIAEIAGLAYDEALTTSTSMGKEHYWLKRPVS